MQDEPQVMMEDCLNPEDLVEMTREEHQAIINAGIDEIYAREAWERQEKLKGFPAELPF